MAYTALYRKWRPTRFDEVRGQDHIVRTLKNQMNSDRVGHAYLFCGTRGTGKTSVAKIFARAVNCENPIDGSPCNECPTCKAILSGASVNVMEIDAASNNGVDNIREIREEVKYKPTEGKYRVYIIDEVHMLSTGAANALLKTLEEPPEYVIFILATTEAHRIPITVKSRCQRYDFKRLSREALKKQVEDLLKAEGFEYEDAAASYIARAADGSSRDALSLLEQCISFFYGETLTYEKVLDVLGAVDQEVFSNLIKRILDTDVTGAMTLVDELLSSGRELTQFVTDFTWYLRNLLLLQNGDADEEVLGISRDNMLLMREEAEQMDVNQVMRYIRILSELSNQMRFAASKRVLLEVAIIRMMQPGMDEDLEGLKDRIRYLEDHGTKMPLQAVTVDAVKREAPPVRIQETVEVTEAQYNDYQMVKSDWEIIVESQGRLFRSTFAGTDISVNRENGMLEVLFKEQYFLNLAKSTNKDVMLQEVLKERYQKDFRVGFRVLGKTEAAPKLVPGKNIPGILMDISEEE